MFPLLVGCSGPCVQFAIFHAEWLGWLTFAATVALMAVLWVRAVREKRFLAPIAASAAVSMHPSLWMGNGGSCGSERFLSGALLLAVLSVACVALDWVRPFGALRVVPRLLVAAGVGAAVVGAALVAQPATYGLDTEAAVCAERAQRQRIH